MACDSQHHKLQCSNGSHGWEQAKDFNPKLSSPISHIYGQPTSTRACNSPHVSRQCSNDSSEASKDTWVSARGHPSCQSHVTCSHAYSHRQATRILAAGLISKLPRPQHSQDSLDAGSSPRIQAEILTRAPTS